MKIVVNALSARVGGGQTYLNNLLAHLPDGQDLDVLVFAPVSLALPQDPRIRRGTPRWPTDNPLLRSVWERLAMPGLLARERADLLFCPGGLISTRAPARCRTATMFRNMTPFDARARAALPLGLQRVRIWLLEHLMLLSMKKADLTIFISEFARGVIEARIRLREVQTIPHGIAAAFRAGARPLVRPDRLPAGRYLLYVSKFDSYKHQLEVVQGFARLPRELQRRHPLVLVGEADRTGAARVEAVKSMLCEPHSVHMLGAVPYAQLPAYYQHAEAVLFASSCENCPNILLEALASGRPVLSSNVMPMPEFGGSGIEYFSPFDPDDITRALQRVLEDPPYAAEVAAAALAESRRYDWADSAARTWAALIRLARAHAQPVRENHPYHENLMTQIAQSREALVEMIVQRLESTEPVLRENFQKSLSEVGVRYCALDGLLPAPIAQQIYATFPDTAQMRLMNSFRECKYTSKDFERFDPLMADITFAIQDPRVVQVVERITGISDQVPDSSLYAGGLSAMARGHFLCPHIDNSHDASRRHYRTLNLLYYVSPEWTLDNGGNLELWDRDVRHKATIVSAFNRLVIMETNPWSWHSVDAVRVDRLRCCVSNYYFSPTSPTGQPYFNVTSFSARPGQKTLRALARIDNVLRQLVRRVAPGGLGRKDVYESPRT